MRMLRRIIQKTLIVRPRLEMSAIREYNTVPPTMALAQPGECQITSDYVSLPLLGRDQISKDTFIFTFGTPDTAKPLNLSTCACILAKYTNGDGEDVVRPYTPLSTNALTGRFECMVKVYPQGNMSQHIFNLSVGDRLDFKHIPFNVKIQYPFGKKFIGMIVGGTGITPMIQALHALLGNKEDETEIVCLYGSQTADNILAKGLLDNWAAQFDRFSLTHVLDKEPADSSWTGERGFITGDLIEQSFAKPSSDMLIFVCGPPPMYNVMCGPRNEKELTGILADLGYSAEHVVKF